MRHTYVPGWYFPGGGVEVGEAMDAAAIKEVWEETNIKVSQKPELLGLFQNLSASRRDHIALYRVTQWTQETPFKPNLEIAEAEFFALDNLPENVTKGTLRRIKEVYYGQEQTAQW